MKKIGLLFATVVMLVLFAMSASALEPTGQCGDNVYWNYDSTTGELVISGTGEMSNYSFMKSPFYKSDIRTVVISEGVSSIGDETFLYCENLENITISDSVNKIGNYAFQGCEKLANINIPDSVKSIGNYGTFRGCSSLKNVIIPYGVTIVGMWAFYNCTSLESVTIPDTVTNIDYFAFYNCVNLKSITIPSNLTQIGNYAFYSCLNITIITIPDNVTYIGPYAFSNCKNLTEINIPPQITFIESGTFYGCCSLKTIDLPTELKGIGRSAFQESGLTEIVFPKGLETIESQAFHLCFGLGDVYVPRSVTTFENPFYNSSAKVFIYADSGAANELAYKEGEPIGWSFISPSSPNFIIHKVECDDGSYYLSVDDYLGKEEFITLPTEIDGIKVKKIEAYAFSKSLQLREVCIPEGYKEIGYLAFYLNDSLKTIFVSNTIDIIDETAFEHKPVIQCYSNSYAKKWAKEREIPYKLVDDINALLLGHNYIIHDSIEPTCSKEGKSEWASCLLCEKVLIAQENIPSLSHTYTSVATKEPTHLAEGIMTYACECGDTYTETIEKLKEHTYEKEVTAPTCTKQGYTTFTCACGDSYVGDYVNEKGHSYSSNTVQPTCTKSGTVTTFCTSCGDTNTETIEPTGHNFDGSKCTNCDYDKADECGCNCHKGGISGFFFKIILFFQKIFKTNKTCSCGVNHY